MEKNKENKNILTKFAMLQCSGELIAVRKNEIELLNPIYKEIANKLGLEAAVSIHAMFKGQQLTFPVRLLNPEQVQRIIVLEFDGKNLKELAQKYNYSEKTIRRMIKETYVGKE